MSYLTEEQFMEILNTVSIFSISSPELGDISQYSFNCGIAEEYVSFLRLQAKKLGKLAINKQLSEEANRKGYGSFILDIVNTYAYEVIECGVACRFVTVDADIEYNPETPEFYIKNGFVFNRQKKIKKSDKTISMRRDIFA